LKAAAEKPFTVSPPEDGEVHFAVTARRVTIGTYLSLEEVQ
jgi:hypothetical protein